MGLPGTFWCRASGSHYDEQIRGGKNGKEKHNGSCAVERGRKEEMKAVRSRLMCEVCLPSGTMVMSGLGC